VLTLFVSLEYTDLILMPLSLLMNMDQGMQGGFYYGLQEKLGISSEV